MRLFALTIVLFSLFPLAAQAHRPGESYVFLYLDDEALSGEVHVRLSDMNKAIPLDADEDGIITPEEFAAKAPEVKRYFEARVGLSDGNGTYPIEIGTADFLGSKRNLIAILPFKIVGMGPVQDNVNVRYEFLYDGIDPAHRPMVVIGRNSRTNLTENESEVSGVFGVGQEVLTIDLTAKPLGEIATDYLRQGFMAFLGLGPALLLLIGVTLPMRRGAPSGAALMGRVLSAAGLVFVGVAAGLLATVALGFGFKSPWPGYLGVLGILGLAAVNVSGGPLRSLVVLAAAVCIGMSFGNFHFILGLDQGYLYLAAATFALGAVAALAIVMAVLLPPLSLIPSRAAYDPWLIRAGSLAIALLGAVWFLRQGLLG